MSTYNCNDLERKILNPNTSAGIKINKKRGSKITDQEYIFESAKVLKFIVRLSQYFRFNHS